MEYKHSNIYSECVELSKTSSKESLEKLISIYLKGNKETQKTAKQALKKTKNKKIVYDLIESHLLVSISSNEVFLLLSLGMTMSRYRYLGRYLAYLKQNNIDLQSIGFFKNISNNPLSDSEKDELAKYIIESHDFEVRLFTLAGERNTEKLLDALVDYIAVNGVDEITLKILTDNEIYLELLQEDIYETLKKEPYKNMVLANYLDFSIIGHQILLEQYDDLFLIHSILLRNVFRDRVFYADNFNIRVSLQIIRKQQIEEVDWVCLKEMVIKEIKDIGNIG